MSFGLDRYEYKSGDSEWSHAMEDLSRGARRYSLWSNMARRQFLGQYRGTLIGPFWITITTAMTAFGLGILYSQLFGNEISRHLPYVTVSLSVWALINGYATSGSSVFTSSAHIFQEYPVPLSIFLFRLLLNQIWGFAFRIIVIVGVLLFFGWAPQWSWLLSVLALAGLLFIGFCFSAVFGIINAYFRDFGQMLSAGMTFVFFMTPIFWRADRLGEYGYLVNWNPFHHLIQSVRAPLLGEMDQIWLHFAVLGGVAVVGLSLGVLIFGRFSRRLPYWC